MTAGDGEVGAGPSVAVAVISKCPRAGHSKTRLARTLGSDAALALHRAFLEDLCAQLHRPGAWTLHLLHDPPGPEEARGLDQLTGGRARRIVGVGPRLADDLIAGFRALLGGADRAVIVSGDVPQLTADIVEHALGLLEEHDVVLGPGPDGGYWLVGLREPIDLFSDVAMGGDRVLQTTIALARERGLSVATTHSLTDIDEAQDLTALDHCPPDVASATRRVLAGLDRTAIATQLPTELQIELTNRCNLLCSSCLRTHRELASSADLTVEDYRGIVAELPSLQRVALQLNGEPLLSAAVFDIIREASEAGIDTVMNTNGVLLHSDRVRSALLESGLGELRVSLLGATPDTARVMSGADIHARVVEGVEALVRERGARVRPRVSLWNIATTRTVPELPELVRLAHRIGVDEVYVQRLVLHGHGVARADGSVHGRLDGALAEHVAEAEAVAAELGVSLRASGRLPVAESLAPSRQDNPWLGCWRPWRTAVVTANKKVLPCCISSFTAPYSELERGSLEEQGWSEIWNGPRFQALREGLLAGDPPPFCRGCGGQWSL